MPISQTPRPYDPAQDPGNPMGPHASWPKIVIALAGMISTTLGTVLTVGLFPPDSTGYKLILVAMGFLGAAVTAVAFIVGESRKELASVEGAARIGEAKVQAASDLAVAKETGLPPLPAVNTTSAPLGGPVQP